MGVGAFRQPGFVTNEKARNEMKPLQAPTVFKAHGSHIIDLVFTPDSRYLLSAGMDNLVHQWSVGNWSLAQSYSGHEKSVNSVCLTANGEKFVTASSDNQMLLWKLGSSQPLETLPIKGSSALLSGGDHTLAALDGPWLTIFDFSSHEVLKKFKPFPKRTTALAFSPDEKWLAVGGQGDSIKIHHLPDLEQSYEIAEAHEGFVLSLAFSNDGGRLASTGHEQKCRLWEPEKWGLIGESQLAQQGVQSLAFSPKGQVIAIASDHQVTLLDGNTAEILQTLTLDPKGVYCLAFSPDGKWLACGSADKRIRLWAWPG